MPRSGHVTIVGLLLAAPASGALWAVPRWIERATTLHSPRKVSSDFMAIEYAIEEYRAEHEGRFPEALAQLVTPLSDGHTYLRTSTVPRDPWGRPYEYSPPSTQARAWTLGRDGRLGGADEELDEDIRVPADLSQPR